MVMTRVTNLTEVERDDLGRVTGGVDGDGLAKEHARSGLNFSDAPRPGSAWLSQHPEAVRGRGAPLDGLPKGVSNAALCGPRFDPVVSNGRLSCGAE